MQPARSRRPLARPTRSRPAIAKSSRVSNSTLARTVRFRWLRSRSSGIQEPDSRVLQSSLVHGCRIEPVGVDAFVTAVAPTNATSNDQRTINTLAFCRTMIGNPSLPPDDPVSHFTLVCCRCPDDRLGCTLAFGDDNRRITTTQRGRSAQR